MVGEGSVRSSQTSTPSVEALRFPLRIPPLRLCPPEGSGALVCWARRPRARERRRKLWKGGHPPYPPRARGSAPPASQAAPTEYGNAGSTSRSSASRASPCCADAAEIVVHGPARPPHANPAPARPAIAARSGLRSILALPTPTIPFATLASSRFPSQSHPPAIHRAQTGLRHNAHTPQPSTCNTALPSIFFPPPRACWRNSVGAAGTPTADITTFGCLPASAFCCPPTRPGSASRASVRRVPLTLLRPAGTRGHASR